MSEAVDFDFDKAAAVAEQAAEVVKWRGHTRGRYGDLKTGAVCAVGALRTAQYGDPYEGSPVGPEFSAISLEITGDSDIYNLVAWNDDPYRTWYGIRRFRTGRHVVRAFRKAARKLRKQAKHG